MDVANITNTNFEINKSIYSEGTFYHCVGGWLRGWVVAWVGGCVRGWVRGQVGKPWLQTPSADLAHHELGLLMFRFVVCE